MEGEIPFELETVGSCKGHYDFKCTLSCIYFQDCEQTVLDLKLKFFQTIFDWMLATGLFSFSSFLEFIDFCSIRS